MASRYAAVLGLLIFAAVLIRGAALEAAWTPTLGWAITCLVAFAILGAAIGWVAEQTIDGALRQSIATELAERQEAGTKLKRS